MKPSPETVKRQLASRDKRDRIRDVLNGTDFNEFRDAFVRANYKWGFPPRAAVPTAKQLRLLAAELLEVVLDPRSEPRVSCGGLTAIRHDEDAIELRVTL